MRYYQSFPTAIPHNGAGCPRVTHPSATQSSQSFGRSLRLKSFVRLACVRHAASVHPEPGSNSHFKFVPFSRPCWSCFVLYFECSSEQSSFFFKELFGVASLFSCQGSLYKVRSPFSARANASISPKNEKGKPFFKKNLKIFYYLNSSVRIDFPATARKRFRSPVAARTRTGSSNAPAYFSRPFISKICHASAP